MHASPPRRPDASDLIARPQDSILAEVRAARFRHGVRCPRCGCERVKRHGTFSGRERHYCRGCHRTFSDLTGTPAAYSKRLIEWPAFCRCFAASLSVRRSAVVVGVHTTTSFRWRHRLLDHARSCDDQMLSGRVELHTRWFAYSEKGRRRLERPARRSGARLFTPDAARGVDVVFACDERDVAVSALTPGYSTGAGVPSWKLESSLAARFSSDATLTAASRVMLGPARLVARRLRLLFDERLPGSTLDPLQAGPASPLRGVRAYVARFLYWLWRFRGVATRYLPNYLMWHRLLDGVPLRLVALRAMQWPLSVFPERAGDSPGVT